MNVPLPSAVTLLPAVIVASIVARGHDVRVDVNGAERRRPLEHDLELRRHARRRVIEALLAHQVMDRRLVHVAVEDGADDAAVEHVLERLVVRLGDEVPEHVRVG